MCKKKNCNEVVVLQQGSVYNSRPGGREVTGTRKKGETAILRYYYYC